MEYGLLKSKYISSSTIFFCMAECGRWIGTYIIEIAALHGGPQLHFSALDSPSQILLPYQLSQQEKLSIPGPWTVDLAALGGCCRSMFAGLVKFPLTPYLFSSFRFSFPVLRAQ